MVCRVLAFPAGILNLLKIRNGKPGTWQVEWSDGRFHPVSSFTNVLPRNSNEKQDDMPKRFVTIWFRHLKRIGLFVANLH